MCIVSHSRCRFNLVEILFVLIVESLATKWINVGFWSSKIERFVTIVKERGTTFPNVFTSKEPFHWRIQSRILLKKYLRKCCHIEVPPSYLKKISQTGSYDIKKTSERNTFFHREERMETSPISESEQRNEVDQEMEDINNILEMLNKE